MLRSASGQRRARGVDGVASADRTATRTAAKAADKADLLVTGSLITMDDTRPRAEAMAVAGGRILAVGSRADWSASSAPAPRILEHKTGAILPGFVEPHLHLVSSALVFDGVDCSPYTNKTLDAVLAALKAAAATAPAGRPSSGNFSTRA